MKKIILHGHLKDKYPKDISVEAETVAEAVRVLETIPELRHPPGHPWPVSIKNVETDFALFAQTKMEEIHVYPRAGGAGGKGGLMQILLGAVLIAVAVMNPTLSLVGGFVTSGTLFTTGVMMALGGLLQLLVPTPEAASESESSRYLGARGNTVQIGTRILIAYGNNMIPGHYLSFDVDAVDWAGDDAGSGAATVVGENIYVEYDKTTTPLVPVNPRFSSPVASLTNIPTAGWS